MKKTFAVGFIGLFLIGGFLTGLYLINQPTNPFSSASQGTEIVNPVKPPSEDVNSNVEKVVPTVASKTATLEECQKAYGKKKEDADFKEECDVDKNGLINVLDLQKMK